jgi:hypothetical protein
VRIHFGDRSTDEKMWRQKIYLHERNDTGVDWINLAYDTVQLLAFVSVVMNLQVPYMLESFLSS